MQTECFIRVEQKIAFKFFEHCKRLHDFWIIASNIACKARLLSHAKRSNHHTINVFDEKRLLSSAVSFAIRFVKNLSARIIDQQSEPEQRNPFPTLVKLIVRRQCFPSTIH